MASFADHAIMRASGGENSVRGAAYLWVQI